MSARAVGSGTISFGIISIPIKTFTSASSQRLRFNTLHKKCGGRVKGSGYSLCPVDNCVVERTDIVKGYEFARDQYVAFTEEEIRKLDAKRSDALEILEFVPRATVDLVYLRKMRYIGPDRGGDKAYQLLAVTMKRLHVVAVGRLNTHGREQLVLISPYRTGLVMHDLFYARDVRAFDDVGIGGEPDFKPIETELAESIVNKHLAAEFKPDKYKDEREVRVRAAVEQKVAGKEITIAEEAPKAQVIDLFEALKRSLATGEPPNRSARNDAE